ncbi:FHA domain-containing protein [Herpetosiphon llansteffanensis]
MIEGIILLIPILIFIILLIVHLLVFIINRIKYKFDFIEPSIMSNYGGVTGDYIDSTTEYANSVESSLSKWVLEIREPDMASRIYPLMNDSIVLIGRTRGSIKSDINLDNEHISRDHAKITVKNNLCFINDQGSKFGTFIASSGTKNQRLDQNLFQLQLGDVILLGKTGIELELKAA